MDTTSTHIYMIWYRIEMQMEARILLEMRRLCIHWLTLNCNIFFFCNLSSPRKQYTHTHIHTHTHTLALATSPFSSFTPLPGLCYLSWPIDTSLFVYLPVFSSQQTHLCLKIFPLVCSSDLGYSSPSSSQTTMCPQQSTPNFTSLVLNFILEMSSYFQFQLYTTSWWWSSLFLFLSQTLSFPGNCNGFVIRLSLLFKCHHCQYVGIFL